MTVDIKLELSKHSKVMLQELAEAGKNVDVAHKRAGISAQRKMKAEANRQVRKTRIIKHDKLSKLIIAYVRGGGMGTEFFVRVNGEPIPVAKLPHRQNRKGVRFKVRRDKSSMMRGAFVAKMKSGNVGVFKREGDGRLPIKQVFTSGISSAFKDEGPRLIVVQAGEREYLKTLVRNFFTKRKRK